MSVPPGALVLTPAQRRQLATLILRGGMDNYDRTPALQRVLDALIRDLVQQTLAEQPAAPADTVVDLLLRRYSYRLPQPRPCSRAA
jgi:hypothetical protein